MYRAPEASAGAQNYQDYFYTACLFCECMR